MSSRRGSRPITHSPPHREELRRSSRERQIKYVNLSEDLIIHELEKVQNYYSLRLACRNNNGQRSVNNSPNIPSNGVRSYSLRSRYRRYPEEYDDGKFHGSDEEETENRATISNVSLRKSGRRALKKSVSHSAHDDDTYVGVDEDLKDNSVSPSDSRDGFEDTNDFNESKNGVTRRLSMVVHDMPKPEISPSNEKSHETIKCSDSKKVDRECRRQRTKPLEEEVEDDDPVENGTRVYSLRTNRSQSNFYGIEESVPSSRNARQELHAKICKLFPSRRNKNSRFCTSSPTRDDDNQPRRYNDDKDKEREKARSRFMPINFTEKDFAMLPLTNERLKTNSFVHDGDSLALDQQVTFEKVGGLDGHIESLKEIVILPLLYPELFNQFGISASKGVLFYGPPGTGKTLVARALANAGSVNGRKIAFFMRKGADILSKWVGESEDQQLFEQAYQMRPAIIFFDEIDGLAPARSGKQDHIHTSIVSTLLALMDGLKSRGDVIVIGATNRIDAIDPALRRPGRFDRELKFSLPDKNARYAILKIHTSNWKSSILDEDLKWIAENTPGYCGADLKFLCTEAFLSALRLQFPQIYVSNKKLQVDAEKVMVDKSNFICAMRRIVPSCRRDFTVPMRQLNDRVGVLLKPVVEGILDSIPLGYRCTTENFEVDKIQRVVRRYNLSRSIPPCRLLVCGKSEDMGQTSYVLPVLLNSLGHLPIFSLSAARLFSGGCVEETFTGTIQQAISSSSRGTPVLLVIPTIDVWYRSVPVSIWQLLIAALNSFSESTSVLFLATSSCSYDDLSVEIHDLFRLRQTRDVGPPNDDVKIQYFTRVIVEPSLKKPEIFDATMYPEIPVAEETAPVHHYSDEELEELKKSYARDRNELNIHYIDTILRFIRDRRFSYFEVAVDPEEVPDYYDVIKHPMDLSTMLDKANFYKNPEEFLADFALIRDNALEYNSYTDSEGRIIRQMAKALYHKGERAYYEIDSAFLRKLQETEKVLLDNGVRLPGFEDALTVKEEKPKATQISKDSSVLRSRKRIVGKRRASYPFGRKRRRINASSKILKKYKRQNAKLTLSLENVAKSVSETGDLGAEEASGEDSENIIDNIDKKTAADVKNANEIKEEPKEAPLAVIGQLQINVDNLNAVVAKAVAKTKLWPLRELEFLASELSAKIDEFAVRWNREELPGILISIINNWDFDAECSSREDED